MSDNHVGLETVRVRWTNHGRHPENAAMFLDMLVDIQKYEHTLRRVDPMFREMDELYITQPDGSRVKLTVRALLPLNTVVQGWAKWCERAYDRLVAEESRGSTAETRQYEDDDGDFKTSLDDDDAFGSLDTHDWDIEEDGEGAGVLTDEDSDAEVDELMK